MCWSFAVRCLICDVCDALLFAVGCVLIVAHCLVVVCWLSLLTVVVVC